MTKKTTKQTNKKTYKCLKENAKSHKCKKLIGGGWADYPQYFPTSKLSLSYI